MTHLRNWVTSKYGSLRKGLLLEITSLRKKLPFENWVTSKYGSLRQLLILEIKPLRNMAHFEKISFWKLGHFEIWFTFKMSHFENRVTSETESITSNKCENYFIKFYKNLKMPGRHPFFIFSWKILLNSHELRFFVSRIWIRSNKNIWVYTTVVTMTFIEKIKVTNILNKVSSFLEHHELNPQAVGFWNFEWCNLNNSKLASFYSSFLIFLREIQIIKESDI